MRPDPDVILGIGGGVGHDGNAAVLVGGRLIAASQEERYTRIKHDASFPEKAIRDCLSIAGLEPREVSICAFAEKPLQFRLSDRTAHPSNLLTCSLGWLVWERAFSYPRQARLLFPAARFRYAWHHASHAAAAFATSPFERAAFVCVDGKGEDINASIGIADARRTRILYELPYENGLGYLYSLVTYFLGFPSFGSEYKVMGLAPYGEPKWVDQLRRFVTTDEAGALEIDGPIRFYGNFSNFPEAAQLLGRRLGLPPRAKGEALTGDYIDLAASIQALFEEEILKMAKFARRMTGERNLLFAGGCAQNCVAAGLLRSSNIFERVFNSPVAGDMGIGLGAALLYRQAMRMPGDGKVDALGFYLGPEPGPLPREAMQNAVAYSGSIHSAAARLIARGNVVGWVRGRMELGARALGARSILADPRVASMQSILNLKVKFRESFRPFAPAVLAEEAPNWFDVPDASDYMQYTAFLKPNHRRAVPEGLRGLRERLDFLRCDLPSVVHVDYSARLQTVRRDVHEDFHQLLSQFNALTGVPILINTSFNVSGQPIVRTAEEAWSCFRHTDMDFLVVGDSLIRNPNDRSPEEKRSWARRFESFS
jgi:carbamoyltransferase